MLQLPPAEAFFQGYISRHFLWWDALQKNCAKNRRKNREASTFWDSRNLQLLGKRCATPGDEWRAPPPREQLRSLSNYCSTFTIFDFFCEHLRSTLKKVDAQARFGISLMCSPAEIFVLVHGQQRFSDGPTCRFRLLPPAATVVLGYNSEVHVVRTYPLSCEQLRSI